MGLTVPAGAVDTVDKLLGEMQSTPQGALLLESLRGLIATRIVKRAER